jgi:hypothetical protein
VKTNIHYLVVLDGIYTFSLLRLNNTTIWNPLILKLETRFFSADQRRKCLSARCASTANATGSYTDMLHVSPISFIDLLYFDAITN